MSVKYESSNLDTVRIGQLLSRIIPLSQHDVEEILQEQQQTQRRFGDIALAMGLCRPEHVWKAWLHQLESGTQRIDLDRVGIDHQSIQRLPPYLARELNVVPLRGTEDELLLAVSSIPDAGVIDRLEAATGCRIRLVLAEAQQVRSALDRYFPRAA